MPRKRHKAASGGAPPWLNTFADLMNLLLCFFVMLYAFSDVNQEKFEKMSISMANSIGINSNNGEILGANDIITSGMLQLNDLDQYYSLVGKKANAAGSAANGQTTPAPSATDTGNSSSNSSNISGNTEDSSEADINKAMAQIEAKMAEENAQIYDKMSDLTDQYNLEDNVDLSIDKNNKYVLLTMKGSILFDSGADDLKKEALPILSNIGKILKTFKGYSFEVTGYTDNVPMVKSEYKNNKWLSSARALNAAEYLIDQCGIDPEKLKYSGRGPYDPVSSNATPEGRAKNRRIEIKIYNQYSSE